MKIDKKILIGAGAVFGIAAGAGIGLAIHDSRKLERQFESATLMVQNDLKEDAKKKMSEELKKRREEKEKEFEKLKAEIEEEVKKLGEIHIEDSADAWREQMKRIHDMDLKAIYMLNHLDD